MNKTKLKNLANEDLQAISDVVGGLLDKQSAVLRNDLGSKQDLKDLNDWARLNNLVIVVNLAQSCQFLL